ncbi:hypothetical protein [Streptomyces lunalinharesii]|uniref:Secreted protein n=1 Tax=Streptomyces lunalinharesii TaxID=333384 RepID=A0ABN3S6G5_9ACTN
MRKLRKAAVVAAVLGSVAFLGAGAGTANAAEERGGWGCDGQDLNVDILGQVGILNGLLGNALNGRGNPGAQISPMGTFCGGGR